MLVFRLIALVEYNKSTPPLNTLFCARKVFGSN